MPQSITKNISTGCAQAINGACIAMEHVSATPTPTRPPSRLNHGHEQTALAPSNLGVGYCLRPNRQASYAKFFSHHRAKETQMHAVAQGIPSCSMPCSSGLCSDLPMSPVSVASRPSVTELSYETAVSAKTTSPSASSSIASASRRGKRLSAGTESYSLMTPCSSNCSTEGSSNFCTSTSSPIDDSTAHTLASLSHQPVYKRRRGALQSSAKVAPPVGMSRHDQGGPSDTTLSKMHYMTFLALIPCASPRRDSRNPFTSWSLAYRLRPARSRRHQRPTLLPKPALTTATTTTTTRAVPMPPPPAHSGTPSPDLAATTMTALQLLLILSLPSSETLSENCLSKAALESHHKEPARSPAGGPSAQPSSIESFLGQCRPTRPLLMAIESSERLTPKLHTIAPKTRCRQISEHAIIDSIITKTIAMYSDYAETSFLAVSLYYRYIKCHTPRSAAQRHLLAIACALIALKFIDEADPEVKGIIEQLNQTLNGLTSSIRKNTILSMERRVVAVLNWEINMPTPQSICHLLLDAFPVPVPIVLKQQILTLVDHFSRAAIFYQILMDNEMLTLPHLMASIVAAVFDELLPAGRQWVRILAALINAPETSLLVSGEIIESVKRTVPHFIVKKKW